MFTRRLLGSNISSSVWLVVSGSFVPSKAWVVSGGEIPSRIGCSHWASVVWGGGLFWPDGDAKLGKIELQSVVLSLKAIDYPSSIIGFR